MTELDERRAKAVLADRRRAHRIRTSAQEAVDVPIPLLRRLLDLAPEAERSAAEEALGARTVSALIELAPAS